MPQSLSKILVHLIFSTKHREPLIALNRKLTCQEEFRKLLQRYKVAFDERYVWD